MQELKITETRAQGSPEKDHQTRTHDQRPNGANLCQNRTITVNFNVIVLKVTAGISVAILFLANLS